MTDPKVDFSFIVRDNESAVAAALSAGQFIQAYLLMHALIESLLRAFLDKSDDQCSFADLVNEYARYLQRQSYPFPEFVDQLTTYNKRRNRIVHELWRKGFSYTNRRTEPAATAAVIMYGLLIEWLETFDPSITDVGFSFGGA